jgi:hypothetical protein
MARSQAKSYRILMPFTYRGPRGQWKPKSHVRIGPGQELPKLESGEITRLLHEGKICEKASDGTSIANKSFVDMNAEKVDALLSGKSEHAILSIVKATNFNTDTLSRVLVFCQRNNLKQAATNINGQLEKSLAA